MALGTIERFKGGEDKHPTRYYSSNQEKAIANAVGGKQTANSGATMWQKGDVLTEDWLLEAKTCVKHQKSFTIKKEWFEKNKGESSFMGKDHSAVVFNFGPGEDNYYIIDEYLFKELQEHLKSLDNN